MTHHELALMLADMAGLETNSLREEQLDTISQGLALCVSIARKQMSDHIGMCDAHRRGFGILRFNEQRFYSVKLGNFTRDRLGALGLSGAVLTSGGTLAGLVAAGALPSWAGAGALVAIMLALTGRAKPLVTSFGLDEAVTLDLAWREAKLEHNFRLVEVDALVARIVDVEATYGNAGFSPAKLTNALNKLEAIGMIKGAGIRRYQLIERLIISDADQLDLQPA
ncbi:hypothetical protein C8J43_102609 [Sphingomonas sp. PP-CE-1G-424]|nr:hypothetical protein C8J43_102609 [Sphingomonas sp. PP-CE-1G-424]